MRLAAGLAFAAMLIVGAVPVHAEKRVALVIGNGMYGKVARLANPASDAGAIAALFGKAGFDVVETKTNLDLGAMRRALRDFTDAVRDADVAVVFYAGHGIEVNGTNYLIPVDAVLERDIDVEDETVSLDRVSQIIEPAKRLRLIILDACRDNPFASGMKRTVASRSIGRGLARVDVMTADTLIAFAAKDGSTAADGRGPNSPYTNALLQHLITPGLDVRLALGRVRDQVLSSTAGKQEPFVYGSLGGAEVSLVPGAKAGSAPPAGAPQSSEAERAWPAVKDARSVAVLEDFIRRYGDTIYGTLARAELEKLKKSTAPAPPEPGGPSQTTGSIDTNPKPPRGTSYWDHNGSLVYLDASPTGARRFFYYAPRDSMAAVGARRGSLLFEGRRNGNHYSGKAFIFAGRCGTFPYDVSGDVVAEEHVIMTGSAPRVDPTSCTVSSYRADRIEFTYKYRE